MSPITKILDDLNLDVESRDAITRLNRFYTFLSNINEAILRLHKKDELLNEICRISVVDGGFISARITLLDENNEPVTVAENNPKADPARLRKRDERFRSSAMKVLETGEPYIVNDPGELEKLNRENSNIPGGCKSLASFPIRNEEITLGVFTLNSSEPRSFGLIETDMIKQVAGNISLVLKSIDNEEKRSFAEKLLLESQERYADLYENSPDMHLSVDPATGRVIRCNDTLCQVTGYSKAELIGKHLLELYHPDSHEDFRRNLAAFRETGKLLYPELKVVKKDGSVITVLLNTSPVRDSEGKITHSRSIWRDVTETKRREHIEERLWHILKESLNEIYIFDGASFKFQFVNSGALRNLGYTLEEMLEMTPVDIKPDISLEHFREMTQPLVTGQKNKLIFETRHRRKDGSLYDVEVNMQYLTHGGDNVFLAIILDITGEKRRERIDRMRYNIARAVATSDSTGDLINIFHSELKKAIDADNFYIALYDEKTGMLKALIETDEADSLGSWPAARSLSGYVLEKQRPVHLRRNDIRKLVEDDIIDIIGTPAESWLGVPLTMEGKTSGVLVVQSYVNEEAYDESSITTLEIMANEFSLYLEKKEAEEAAEKLSKAIIQSPIVVVITDLKGNIEYVNPQFTTVTGYEAHEVIGRNPRILQSGTRSKDEYKQIWDRILAGKEWHGEFLNRKKNGDLYWEEAVIAPVKNTKGVITNFVAIKEDITDKRRMVEELVQAKEQAEEMNRLKSNFLANMSHELRTPLNGILGFSEIVSEDSNDEDVREMGNVIHKSGKRLLETLNLILDLSRIEAGRLDINTEKVDIVQIAEEVVSVFREEAKKKNLYLWTIFQPGLKPIISDGRLLYEILNNLVNNAIKFTRTGGVVVEISAQHKELMIKVTDTGIGIPKSEQEVIWEEFRQASEGLSRGFEGVGLGLTITRNFVMKLGGVISLDSSPGAGTAFTITLPVEYFPDDESGAVRRTPDKTGVKEAQETKTKPTVLLVDDDPNSIKYVAFLVSGNYNLDSFLDGLSALDAVKQKQYDIILMDINLGKGLSGVDVTQMIRTLPGYAETPIVALTAFAMAGDREEFLEAGCSHYLSKPFSKREFLDLLEQITSGR